jgi:hypothetical protein
VPELSQEMEEAVHMEFVKLNWTFLANQQGRSNQLPSSWTLERFQPRKEELQLKNIDPGKLAVNRGIGL